jgi:hypothetical protein
MGFEALRENPSLFIQVITEKCREFDGRIRPSRRFRNFSIAGFSRANKTKTFDVVLAANDVAANLRLEDKSSRGCFNAIMMWGPCRTQNVSKADIKVTARARRKFPRSSDRR